MVSIINSTKKREKKREKKKEKKKKLKLLHTLVLALAGITLYTRYM